MGFGLLAPLAATAVLAMLVFILSMVIWAREVDIKARMREESLVRQGTISRIAEVERSISPQTDWGEALAHLDHRFDREWARRNLTAYLAQAGEFETIFVIGADGRPRYASRRGQDTPLALYEAYRGTDALLADVREGERRRGPIAPPAPGAPRRMLTRPIQASAFFVDHGEVHLATASLVQPDFGDLLPKGDRAPIVLAVSPMDAAVLAPLRERFQLDGLTASLQGPRTGRRLAQVQFPTLRGGPAIDLTWAPQRPGTELLRAAILPILLVIAAFAAVGAAMVHRARRAAAQLIASNRAQSEFLANMSHEIRTPLNGVVAIAGVLEKTALNARQAELVGVIRSSGETLERLLSDVLDLSKIETGALAIETEPFHLAETLRGVAALCGPRGEEKGVSLRVEIPPAAEAMVLGDVVRVKQVVTNLVSNAVKFTEQGHVTLRLKAGRIPDAWRIEVEDTGVGFDPAKKSRIFARFQQADGSVTRRYGGSGLGLSICRQLVDLMGGSLDCDSRPGSGSTFTVELPLPRAEPAAHERQPAFDADRLEVSSPPAADSQPTPTVEFAERRLRVLLADDHPTNRTVVQVMIAHLEIDLVVVENGLEACEAFEADRFDVVLMDMQMPVMDGLSAIRRLRLFERRSALSPALMVMLTANAMREHQDQSLQAGADLHLSKPIEAARLFAALQQGAARAAKAASQVA